MTSPLMRAAVAAALAVPLSAFPSEQTELAELKRQLDDMKRQYEARIGALEERLKTAESLAAAPAPAPASEPAPVSAPARGDNAFNPAISMVVQGSAVGYSRDPDGWALAGFQTGGEAGLKPQGLSLTETELTVSASADALFFGQATVGLHDDGGTTEVSLEEAFVDTLSLPAGLGLRFGRFYTETGYINTHHSHAWDFADAPLTSQAFLGRQYGDDGLRLSWLAPTTTYLELGAELLRGERFPAGGDGSRFLGDAQNYFLRLGGDVGAEHGYRVGLSHLRASPEGRASGGHAHDGQGSETFAFTGHSELTVADLVWKWAPDGNPRERNLVLQGEYFYRDENGHQDFLSDGGTALLPYDGTQQGFYVQGTFQFMPRWRVGLRYDRLWTDNRLSVSENDSGETDADLIAESGLVTDQEPYRWSLMTDFSPGEFSRLRLQYARDHSRPGGADDQVQLQYVLTLGAHGAHRF